jgi:micrococcal nuclease
MRFPYNKRILIVITSLVLALILEALPSTKTKQSISESPNKENTQPSREKTKVIKVIDGDTIEITGNQKVRYIGMDTPEISDKKECYGIEASNKNKDLVLNQEIEIEKDVSETDRFGRLLRYVYIEGQMVNEILIREGFAKVSTFPPDIKNKDIFLKAEQEARNNNKGLWGTTCNN